MEPQWSVFCLKIVKWVALSECYPFRTSLLVQILEDMDQKKSYGVRNPNGLLAYQGINDVDFESMTLVEFYFNFVSRLIREIPAFKKLNRLDSDPELFVSYLSIRLSGSSKYEKNREEKIDIVCSDVLGPLIDPENCLRDLNFSLLTHSFNLNPAMRSIIALEVQNMKSPTFVLRQREGGEGEYKDARGR